MWAILSAANRVFTGDGWVGGSAVAVLGTLNADLGAARPAGRVRLRVVSILGTVNVRPVV